MPEHLAAWWAPAYACLHSAAWWRRHWERTGIVDVELADAMPDGWRLWLAWQRAVAPGNAAEIARFEADRGRYLGYVRVVARRRRDVELDEPIVSVPGRYRPTPLLRE